MSSLTLAIVGDVPQPIPPGTTYDVRLVLSGDDGPQPATETLTGTLLDGHGNTLQAVLTLSRLVPDSDGPDHSQESLASSLASSVIVQNASDPLLYHVTAH